MISQILHNLWDDIMMQPGLSGMWPFLVTASWLREKTSFGDLHSLHTHSYLPVSSSSSRSSSSASAACWSHEFWCLARLLKYSIFSICLAKFTRSWNKGKRITKLSGYVRVWIIQGQKSGTWEKPGKSDWHGRMEKLGSTTCIMCSFFALLHKTVT